ncbi:hypothetical protein AUC47_04875 [Microbacterium sp. SZ1]|uniref:hypothetical protein n=1 Tax=Microbacterium sp. SZ1 TaxID=1849736 RepID=UPI000BD151C7|nr:hypothetical protein [Microbacterium sp. SZ1]PCE13984.1 hypothetical protein AUC47_04875 [Microbacterium sp. SZ1]
MPNNTPIYGLPYLVGSDRGRNIQQVSEQLALTLDATLAATGNPPLDSDLVSLLQRLGELENQVDELPKEMFVTNRPTSGGQTVAAAWNTLVAAAYGAPAVNEVGAWAGGALTIAEAGVYQLSLNVGYAGVANPIAVQIVRNTTTPDTNVLASAWVPSSATTGTTVIAPLNANDVIRGLAYSSIGTTATAALSLVRLR